MTARWFAIGGFAVIIAGCLGAESEPVPADFARDVVPFLSKRCFYCHGHGNSKGGLSLDRNWDDEAVQNDRDVWENVINVVRAGTMPPKGKTRKGKPRRRLTPREYEPVLRAAEAVLARDDEGGRPHAGRVTLRRLNRSEYNNTIRDLLGVDFEPAADFPEDDPGYGFDNIGDVLSLSPLLFEKYLNAAETVLERALAESAPLQPDPTRAEEPHAAIGTGDPRRGRPEPRAQASVWSEGVPEAGGPKTGVAAQSQQVGRPRPSVPLRIDGKSLDLLLHLPFARASTRNGPGGATPPTLPQGPQRVIADLGGLPPREAARDIVERLATRALRRPIAPSEVDRFLNLYDRAEAEGEAFVDRVRLALQGVLVAPGFLFRVELDPPGAEAGATYPVGEFELATRLSYFLWSTMPDEELFDAARQGRLRKDLDAQVRRMLRDPKSAEFVHNFTGQWLTLRNLKYAAPDPNIFPGFDEELRSAMARETELFFESIVREDRSVFDLIDSDYGFVNGRLARHYGIDGVSGDEFRRVRLPADRGGVLTQASILTLTSNSTRTSPVKRGKWVLEEVINSPPPPPPPDILPLPEGKRLAGSLRQNTVQHRENADCASCHRLMDPIGFALENYDAIGTWRDSDNGIAIDATGELPGGRVFQGAAGLKAVLRGEKDRFSRGLVERVLTYALGRGLEGRDRRAVSTIVEALRQSNYRFSVLLTEVVKSAPFQMRKATGGDR